MKIKMWHWRDILCWIKLKTSIGYKVRELCGKCEKCNGIFAATGIIPCPMRFNNDKLKNNEIYDSSTKFMREVGECEEAKNDEL